MAVLMGLLALGLAGCARWFPHGHGGFDRSLTIVTPRDRLQVPADGTVPVLVRVDRPLTASTLRLALATGGRPPVDLTARLHETPQGFAATLTSTDLVPGLSRLIVSARPSRHDAEEAQHSDTSFASAMLSWEPAVDVSLATRCDFLGQSRCALPFPNDWFPVRDSSAATGRRVHLDAASLPANVAGAHTDPAEWNRNDGFSPGAMILATVPGVDLAASGAPPITDIGRSLAPDSPIVLVDADTGAHWPFFAELDANATSDANRALIIRPARNLLEGHRYIVAMHHLENTSAAALAPSRAFQLYRDRIPTFIPVVEGRRWHMESIFETLHHAGVGRSDLTLAWDFTVASERNLSERMLHIRDDAFKTLGANAPAFTVTKVDENPNP
ncbi:MAG: hypothetical protein ACXVIM_13735, partial [Acidimicrobiia bacterium]